MNTDIINKNSEISQYLLDKFKLWIWDFDDTLIDTTTYYRKSMKPEDILKRSDEELDIDFPNWLYFRDLVFFLVSRGVRVGIASFGTYHIIRAYMDRIFGVNQRIFTSCNLKALCRDPVSGKPLRYHPNKNEFMNEIMEHFRVYEPLKVILFDDNMTNIAEALAVEVVGVKIKGKSDNNIGEYTDNPEENYFGEYIVNKLESTLKKLDKREKSKANCPPNNKKNEIFSSIGSRTIGTINKSNRIARESLLNNIKKQKQKDNNDKINTEIKKTLKYLSNHTGKSIPIMNNKNYNYEIPVDEEEQIRFINEIENSNENYIENIYEDRNRDNNYIIIDNDDIYENKIKSKDKKLKTYKKIIYVLILVLVLVLLFSIFSIFSKYL